MNITVFDLLKNRGILSGSIVLSKAGHDVNNMYIVLSVENKMALLVDGILKNEIHPKKKRVTHLKTIGILDNKEQRINQLKSTSGEPDQNKLIQEWFLEILTEHRNNKKKGDS